MPRPSPRLFISILSFKGHCLFCTAPLYLDYCAAPLASCAGGMKKSWVFFRLQQEMAVSPFIHPFHFRIHLLFTHQSGSKPGHITWRYVDKTDSMFVCPSVYCKYLLIDCLQTNPTEFKLFPTVLCCGRLMVGITYSMTH